MKVSIVKLVPLIIHSLQSGHNVRLKARGSSMLPFIRNCDCLEIRKITKITIGKIVLCEYPEKVFTIHRIVKISNSYIWTRGDCQLNSLGPIPKKNLIAEVIKIYSKQKVINLEKECWVLLGLVWIIFYPLDQYFLRYVIKKVKMM